MGLFERWLSVWVAACIAAGVGLGLLAPRAFEAVAALEAEKTKLADELAALKAEGEAAAMATGEAAAAVEAEAARGHWCATCCGRYLVQRW